MKPLLTTPSRLFADAASPTAVAEQPIPTLPPEIQTSRVTFSLRIIGRQTKRTLQNVKRWLDRKIERAAHGESYRLLELSKRQASTGCNFTIKANNVTVFNIDLGLLNENTTLDFATDSFNPQNTTLQYIESCPPGVPFPILDIANLTLVSQVPPPAPEPEPVNFHCPFSFRTLLTSSKSSISYGTNVVFVTVTTTRPGSTVTTTQVVTTGASVVTSYIVSVAPGTTIVSVLTQSGVERTVTQSGIERTVTQTGIERTVTQTGIERTVTQTGIERTVTTTATATATQSVTTTFTLQIISTTTATQLATTTVGTATVVNTVTTTSVLTTLVTTTLVVPGPTVTATATVTPSVPTCYIVAGGATSCVGGVSITSGSVVVPTVTVTSRRSCSPGVVQRTVYTTIYTTS